MMNQDQAIKLFQLITDGPELGSDGAGDIVHAPTKLQTAIDLLGHRPYLYRTGNRHPMPAYDTAPAVAFLKEWAEALGGSPL